MRFLDYLVPEDFIPAAPTGHRRELRRLLKDQGAGALLVAADWLDDHGYAPAAELLRVIASYRPARWWTMEDIRHANMEAGYHWFATGTMRWWGTRLCPGTVCVGPSGIYFVTSDRTPSGRRVYSVRHFDPNTGSVGTADENVGEHSNRRAAHRAAVRYSVFGSPRQQS